MKPFDDLLPLLIEAIPTAVAASNPTKRLCAVRIYFYDTHAPRGYLTLRTVSDDDRTRIVADKGRDAPFYLWAAGEECGQAVVHFPSANPTTASNKQLLPVFDAVYARLEQSEEEHMPMYRAVLQKVAWKLNEKDWKSVCCVSDDFVVAPADGSLFFGGDDYADLIESIPKNRLDALRTKRLLGPEESWDQLK